MIVLAFFLGFFLGACIAIGAVIGYKNDVHCPSKFDICIGAILGGCVGLLMCVMCVFVYALCTM